jgi:hypothetical protein
MKKRGSLNSQKKSDIRDVLASAGLSLGTCDALLLLLQAFVNAGLSKVHRHVRLAALLMLRWRLVIDRLRLRLLHWRLIDRLLVHWLLVHWLVDWWGIHWLSRRLGLLELARLRG